MDLNRRWVALKVCHGSAEAIQSNETRVLHKFTRLDAENQAIKTSSKYMTSSLYRARMDSMNV